MRKDEIDFDTKRFKKYLVSTEHGFHHCGTAPYVRYNFKNHWAADIQLVDGVWGLIPFWEGVSVGYSDVTDGEEQFPECDRAGVEELILKIAKLPPYRDTPKWLRWLRKIFK